MTGANLKGRCRREVTLMRWCAAARRKRQGSELTTVLKHDTSCSGVSLIKLRAQQIKGHLQQSRKRTALDRNQNSFLKKKKKSFITGLKQSSNKIVSLHLWNLHVLLVSA